MDELKKNIKLNNYNNEFSKALLDSENIFYDIYQHCNFEFDLNLGHTYLMEKIISILLKCMINKNFYLKNQKKLIVF